MQKISDEALAGADDDGLGASLRKDGDIIVSGRATYLDDVELPRTLHCAILRSPHPKARITSMDTSAALAAPGVHAVLTGQDVASITSPLPYHADPSRLGVTPPMVWCLAPAEVNWVGEPVAAVAAETLALAESAAAKINVDYQVAEFVTDTHAARRADAPRVFPDWESNTMAKFSFQEGDAAGAITTSEHVIEGHIPIQRYQTSPMEGRGYLANWRADDRLEIYASTQNPHLLRMAAAQVLRVPESAIVVRAPRVGGAFGHKFNGYPEEYVVCVLSRLTGRPVKWLESRREGLLVGAREFDIAYKSGFNNDGTVQGLQVRMLANIGALGTAGGWSMASAAGMTMPGPYRIKHYDVTAEAVVTNKAPWSGARGYGKEVATLVMERIIDRIARQLLLDSADVRLTNFIPADEFPYWTAAKHLDSGDYATTLELALDLSDYRNKRRLGRAPDSSKSLRGIGIGFELTPEGGDFAGTLTRGYDSATVRISPAGSVTVLTGVTHTGSGNDTTIATLVARELGLRNNQVAVSAGDTDISPFGFGSFSSRSTATAGQAAILAARELRVPIATAASVLLSCSLNELEFKDGHVQGPTGSVPFAEAVRTVYTQAYTDERFADPTLEVTKISRPDNFHHTPDALGRTSAYPTFPYSAHIAEVEVDCQTGVTTLMGYTVVDDCGTVISPQLVRSQILGAVVMGIGGALFEDLPYDDEGHPVADTFKTYLLPRSKDLPAITTASTTTPSPFTMLGSKGAGESGVGGAIAAVANAVNDALAPLGVSVEKMPLTPPRVLAAILGIHDL